MILDLKQSKKKLYDTDYSLWLEETIQQLQAKDFDAIELGKMLLDMLEAVKVYPMAVEIGKQIDYKRHEPFDVQPDENLLNEDIKEVTRQGYEYEPETDLDLIVLRSARVVVVNNN